MASNRIWFHRKKSPKTSSEHGIDNLPGTLLEALGLMENDPLMADTLGAHAYESFLAGKYNEWDSYRTQVSEWEIDQYMVLY